MTRLELSAVLLCAAVIFVVGAWCGLSLIWGRRHRPAPRGDRGSFGRWLSVPFADPVPFSSFGWPRSGPAPYDHQREGWLR